jgi:hypothetical protein
VKGPSQKPHLLRPAYLVLLTWAEDRVSLIRDYPYARYVMRDATIAIG